jgi:hypothetical protein
LWLVQSLQPPIATAIVIVIVIGEDATGGKSDRTWTSNKLDRAGLRTTIIEPVRWICARKMRKPGLIAQSHSKCLPNIHLQR